MRVRIPEFPNLPHRLSRLADFAYNLWWSWNGDARELLRSVNPAVWVASDHNAIRLLRETTSEQLHACSENQEFLQSYDSVLARFDQYLKAEDTWFLRYHPEACDCMIAYFCAEFAVHSSLPIYSGGLGVLAGDTCKEASDLGLPFIAVGSLYPEGYFRQVIDADGHQQSTYARLKTLDAPILPLLEDDGSQLIVTVPIGNREVKVAIWKAQAGRVPIYLMDTDIEANEPWDRDLSARLYGGDQQVRLRQEIILGMGGVRVLRAVGCRPKIHHLNEGHAAFAGLELIREYMQEGKTLEQSVALVRKSTAFTTHTPVKAGHDEFPFYMMEEYFRPYWEKLGISREKFLSLGQTPDGTSFSMTILALAMSGAANSVSRKHGEVSREMWHFLWPGSKVTEVPIRSVTNGVHVPTWLAARYSALYEKKWGSDFLRRNSQESWDTIAEIPDEDLWRIHLRLKGKLHNFVRERARQRIMRGGLSSGQALALGSLLSPDALTIGFARRFATYKRAMLILQDKARLLKILNDPLRPVQIVFSGKAHPADEPGKFYLQQVFKACGAFEFGGRIAFIEDYDTHVAHYLVQGVDIWLNNPEPPKEASGTSGQKAALNGIPNLSVLDGWWYEGHTGKNGWAIDGFEAKDQEAANSIYDLLEKEIVRLYYERDAQGIPHGWVQVMKEAVRTSAVQFSTFRMLTEYVTQVYQPLIAPPD